jgi:hypothetical protein
LAKIQPRDWVLANMTDKVCAAQLMASVDSISAERAAA